MSTTNSQTFLLTFCCWLTRREGTLKVGHTHNVTDLLDRFQEFSDWNDLADESGDLPSCMFPPKLWYRNTPALAGIEWRLRKTWRDVFGCKCR